MDPVDREHGNNQPHQHSQCERASGCAVFEADAVKCNVACAAVNPELWLAGRATMGEVPGVVPVAGRTPHAKQVLVDAGQHKAMVPKGTQHRQPLAVPIGFALHGAPARLHHPTARGYSLPYLPRRMGHLVLWQPCVRPSSQ
jgi:hypothetical protein